MAVFIVYLIIAVAIVYFIQRRDRPSSPGGTDMSPARKKTAEARKEAREVWKQVYETASMDEARGIQERLESENIRCILYEQGKKDIYGNVLKGIGIAVPSGAAEQAQTSIARMPV